jgi:hypothetical protein
MHLVLAVRTLVFLLQSDVTFPSYPYVLCRLHRVNSDSLWMASVDAAGSCGSHPGRFFGIGRLVVELLYAYYFVEQSYLVVNCGSLCLSMCSLDAARSSGWNPGICIATRDLLPDLSPLLGRVHQINL